MLRLTIDASVFLPVYYPYLFDYSRRYNIYWGGRSSGKTYFIIQKLLIKGLKEKRHILLMKKTTAAVKDSVWRELNEAIDRFQLRPYFDFNKTEYRAVCKINGTEFHCMGLDIAEKIKGYADISDAYLDEVTAFNMEDIELIDGTVRSLKYKLPLQLYFSFNPIGKTNFVYKYFRFDTNETENENTFVLHTTYLDNPKSNSFIRMEELKKRNYARWRIEALGEWVSLDKHVYENWEIRDFDYRKIITDRKPELLLGLDFGFSTDPTALICSLLDEKEKTIYIFQEWEDRGRTNPEIAKAISALGFAKSKIIADSADPKSCEELRRLGLTRLKESVKGPDSILHGIQRIQQYHLVIHPSCSETISEIENYTWQKDKATGEYINKPVDAFNHLMDSLRYSLQCVDGGKIGTIKKSSIGV